MVVEGGAIQQMEIRLGLIKLCPSLYTGDPRCPRFAYSHPESRPSKAHPLTERSRGREGQSLPLQRSKFSGRIIIKKRKNDTITIS